MNLTSQAALEFLHRLLCQPAADQAELPGLLAGLAGAFGAPAAGVAALPEGQALARHPDTPAVEEVTWPWQDDPSLLCRFRQAPGAVALERAGCPMLVTTFTGPDGAGWVVWLEGAGRGSFDDGEAASLGLVGLALTRWLASDARPRWADRLELAARQQRLETAATVTRRLAHDFGNVLTGILGFTELALAQQVPANTPLHTYLNEVYRAAQTGAQFTHQLRLISRRQSASSRGSQLAAVFAEQEARLFAAQPDGLNLRLTLPADLPPVALDDEHLHQVLTALLDNARESLMGPGTISVSARVVQLGGADCQEIYGATRPGPHVEVVIADTGAGLSPEVQRRLLAEPFFTTKPRRRGFGLAVTHGVLHAHKGGFRLHPGEERGVVARLLLPVAPAPLVPPPPAEEAVRPTERLKGERVLVVDDESEVLQYVTASLGRAGFRVEPVSTGEAALQAYFAQPADPFGLVLTDVVMPGVGGVELARRLLRRDPAVRMLFMSGHVSTDFTRQDFAEHAFEFLAKPFRPEQLLKAVRAALSRDARPARRRDNDSPALTGAAKR
ncbi:MAG: response regulator [Gemmataceae bacterium]